MGYMKFHPLSKAKTPKLNNSFTEQDKDLIQEIEGESNTASPTKWRESLEDLIDLSRIPVIKGTNSRLGWTKYSDLYEIVHPSLDLISLCLLTGA